MGNMQGSDKQSKTNKSPAKSKNFIRNLNRKTPLRDSYKNIRKKSESRDVKKTTSKKEVVNSKESVFEHSDDLNDVELAKCVQKEEAHKIELDVRGTQVTDLTCHAELSARSSNRDQTPDRCSDIYRIVACASPRSSQSLQTDNKDSHTKNEHNTDKTSEKKDSTPTKDSSSDSVFTDPLTPLGFSAEINQCYYSAESDSAAEDQHIQVRNNKQDVLYIGNTDRPCSRLSISRVSQINLYNSLSDYTDGTIVINSECNMSYTEIENNNAINTTPFNVCATEKEIYDNNNRVDQFLNNQFDSGDVSFSDRTDNVMGSVLSQGKSFEPPDSENISNECNNDSVESRLKHSGAGAQMSFTLSRHRKVELPPSKLTDVCLINNATGSPEVKRHSSTSDACSAGDSNVLRKVASLTFDNNALDNKAPKSKFVPEKLDFQIYEKFEGQMLVNWFVSAISDQHHLRSMLSLQDLRSLSGQYCSHLLAAGVLRQIADKNAPRDTNFRPDLMYYWAHTETLPHPPSTPGRIQMSTWSPLYEYENKMRSENHIVDEKRRNSSKAENTINKSPFKKQDDSITINVDKITKPCSCSSSTLPNSELIQKLKELELQTLRLKKELEKYKMLVDIDNLTQSALSDFSSPVREKLLILSENDKEKRFDVGTQTLDVDPEQYTQASRSINDIDNEQKSVIRILDQNEDNKIVLEKKKSIAMSHISIRNIQTNENNMKNDIPKNSDLDNVHDNHSKIKNLNMINGDNSELKNSGSLHLEVVENNVDLQLDTNRTCTPSLQKADILTPKRLPNGVSHSEEDSPAIAALPPPTVMSSVAETTHLIGLPPMPEVGPPPPPMPEIGPPPSPVPQTGPPPLPVPQTGPPPPPMPGMGLPPFPMPGLGPPPPSPVPQTGPPPPPMPGMGLPPSPMPGLGPPPPSPVPQTGPPPPPMPGMGLPPSPMPGLSPPPPPMPGMGLPPPPMPEMGPPPPPMPGTGPPPPGIGPLPPPMPEIGPPPPPMPGLGPPPPSMPGMGPPPPPLPGMAPRPPPMNAMSGMCPPPPPINGMCAPSPACGAPPPPPSPSAAGPMPFPTPPVGGWNVQKACLRKTPIVPVVPMKPLYWTRILAAPAPSHLPPPQEVPENFKPLWLEIEEARLDNIDEFSQLFSRQVVTQKVVKKKVAVSTKVQPKKVLDSKRSQNVGILAQSLHVEFAEIENAIYNFDTSVVSLEALQQIYELRATEEEISQIKEHLVQNPSVPLDKPETFLHDLASIPHFAERISCFMFQADFQDAISTIMHKLDNLKHTCEFLMNSEHLKKLFAIILTLGNYMNGGNGQRGQADGFGLEILAKLRDVKSKDSTVTLLHFIVRTYMRSYGGALGSECVLPVPLPGDVERAANVNFDDVHRDLAALQRQLEGCKEKTKKVLSFEDCQLEPKGSDSLPDESFSKHKAVFEKKMSKFLHTAEDKLKSESESLQDCQHKFAATMRFYQFVPKKGKLEECQPKDFFVFWSPFCSDFKDIFKKEEQIAIKERLKENKRQQEDRRNKSKVLPKKEGGLKARLQRLAAKK